MGEDLSLFYRLRVDTSERGKWDLFLCVFHLLLPWIISLTMLFLVCLVGEMNLYWEQMMTSGQVPTRRKQHAVAIGKHLICNKRTLIPNFLQDMLVGFNPWKRKRNLIMSSPSSFT